MRRAARLFQAMLLVSLCFLVGGGGNAEADKAPPAEAKPEAPATPEKPTVPDPKSPKSKPASRTAELQAALDDGIALLEQGNLAEFTERYLPVEHLRTIRTVTTVAKAAQEMKADRPESVNEIKKELIALKSGKIEFLDEAQTLASITVDKKIFDENPPRPIVLPDPAREKIPATKGFAGDLNQALAQAQAALEAGEHRRFVENVFPKSELKAATTKEGLAELSARLKAHPEMVEQMVADLKDLRQLKPELDAEQTTATFRVFGENQSRTFQFTKWQGTWRMADHAETLRAETYRQSQRPPIGRNDNLVIKWERLRDHWRIYETDR